MQPPLPLLLLPDGTLHSLPRSKSFHVSGCAGYGSACGKWLVFSRDDSGCFLMDPFSKATVTFPALASIRRPFGESYFAYQMGITHMMIKESKQILFSPHLVAAIFNVHWSSHIALCRPGSSSWSILTEKHFGWDFSQMSFHKGNLYTLTCNEDLFAVNITKDDITSSPWVSHLGQVIKGPNGLSSTFTASRNGRLSIRMLYLVESRDTLLMVRRTLFCRCRRPSALALKDKGIVVERNDFKVFEADLRQLRWAEVKTIGDDQSLFLGRRCSRAMSVSQYDMPGNHIFFLELDDHDRSLYGEKSLSSCSAYNIRDGTFSSPLPTGSWKRGMGFATWLFPQN